MTNLRDLSRLLDKYVAMDDGEVMSAASVEKGKLATRIANEVLRNAKELSAEIRAPEVY